VITAKDAVAQARRFSPGLLAARSKARYSIRRKNLPFAVDSGDSAASLLSRSRTHPISEELMETQALKELFIDELRDLYNAESQLIKALPKMAKAATSEELRTGFEEHLEQTKGHAQRLEQIFQTLGEKPSGKKCKAMEGLIAEGSEAIEGDFEGEVMDAALIGAARRVEHYEMAAYSTVIKFGELLGQDEAVNLLEQTLEEETETDEKLVGMVDAFTVEDSVPDEESDADRASAATNNQKKARSARA
jgi:ferritin-like metal-binding protein YciE